MAYIGVSPSNGVRQKHTYTVSGTSTDTFSGAGAEGISLSYLDSNYVDVYQNGVKLGDADYTATNGTSIVLGTTASDADIVEIVVYDVFSVADTVSKADGGTFDGNVTMAGTLAVTGNATFSGDIIKSTAGTSNFAAGVNAGNSITSGGNFNTVVGDEAGTALTTGDDNTALGYGALYSEDAHGKNTAIGTNSLLTLNAGADGNNTAVGYFSGKLITTGIYNTFIGASAGENLTDADYNVGMGMYALGSDTKGSKSTAIGYASLFTQNFTSATDSRNTAVGYNSGYSVTTGTSNVLVGSLCGDALTVGNSNVAVGDAALTAETAGDRNVAIGYLALATQNFTSSTDAYNVGVGWGAGEDLTTGTKNVFIGGLAGDATQDSSDNTAVGYNAMGGADSGGTNTAVGSGSLFNVTGYDNTGLGMNAGANITSGTNNLMLGHDAGITGSPGGNITGANNTIVLGDENIQGLNAQVSLSVASDQRDKTDFTALDIGLDFVNALKPYTYKWDKRSKYGDKTADDYDLNSQTPDGTYKEDWLDIGFKAQEVEVLEKSAGYKVENKTNLTISLTEDGKQYGMKYEKFVPILVKAVQELSAKNDALEARLTTLEGE